MSKWQAAIEAAQHLARYTAVRFYSIPTDLYNSFLKHAMLQKLGKQLKHALGGTEINEIGENEKWSISFA